MQILKVISLLLDYPDVALRDLEAVVTEANADDLHWQIREALGAADDPKS